MSFSYHVVSLPGRGVLQYEKYENFLFSVLKWILDYFALTSV